MRTLYFDCFAGASGDMILGALVQAGVDQDDLIRQLALLNTSGYSVSFDVVNRSGISAVYARVETSTEKTHRHLSGIVKIINESHLSQKVKDRAIRIFTRLAEAEARVHGVSVERVHFHEVGALDAIVDVVGACIGFEMLGIERFISSPVHVGSGTIEIAHGRFPVPPPAVTELMRGAPVYSTDITGELLTPTGASIISTVCDSYGPLPLMRTDNVGYGAGRREIEKFPNVLRIFVGEAEGIQKAEKLWIIESNIDDASPQILGYFMEESFSAGALDCFFTHVQMKKNRPGVLVSILCEVANREKLCQLLFAETPTLGVRYYEVERQALEREMVRVETEYGLIDVKAVKLNGNLSFGTPEYEQCRAVAVRVGVPLREVERVARTAFDKLRDEGFNW